MRFYQTAEPESVFEISEKTGVSPEILARSTGVPLRGVVPGGVSLLLPAGAGGKFTVGSGICTHFSEGRAEVVLCKAEPERSGGTPFEPLFGATCCQGGVLGERGVTQMRPARKGSTPLPLLSPAAWTGELPPPKDLAELLVRAGYAGLLLPVEEVMGHTVTEALSRLAPVFTERNLILGISLGERAFLNRASFYARLEPSPALIFLSPARHGVSLEERVRDLTDATDLPTRCKLLISLSTGAVFSTHEKSAPLPYGEALKLLLSSARAPWREDLLRCPLSLRGTEGLLTLEDPAALYPGLVRLGDAKIGGISLSERHGMPFACEMISRLFKTAGGKAVGRWSR